MIVPTFRRTAGLALVAIAAAVLVAAQPAQQSTRSPVVGAAWLAQHLGDRDLVLLHVGDPAEYAKAHLPGARLVSLRDVSVSSHDHDNGLMLEMPSPDSLRGQLARLGISDGSRVVVYYGGDWVSPATRVLFTLDYAGLGARASLLDGGMQRWIEAGHPTTAEVPAPRTGTLGPLALRPLVVDAAWVRSRLRAPGIAIVDARAPSFYDGVEATGPRKGHLPGARSVPFTELADDSLRIRPTAELAALFAKAGVQRGDTIVGYCHIGQQATAMLLAARITGHPIRLYDGSMQEWSRRTDLPLADR
jgi:thiosulfate/3-mercaptopyruvate sulfurtransferase